MVKTKALYKEALHMNRNSAPFSGKPGQICLLCCFYLCVTVLPNTGQEVL